LEKLITVANSGQAQFCFNDNAKATPMRDDFMVSKIAPAHGPLN